jgi:hypothetical protein
VKSEKGSFKEFLIPAALLAALVLQGIAAARDKSPTCDEYSHHVANGFSYLVTGDFRMNPASPPLPRMLTAIPLLLVGAKAPLDDPSWEAGNSPQFADRFFNQPGQKLDNLIFWARMPILALSVLFGLAVYAWAKMLWGLPGGISALTLYVFSPDILAHSSLAASDLAVGFFMFMTFFHFWKYLHKDKKTEIYRTGLDAGLSLLSKFTAVLLFPILLITAVAAGKASSVRPKKTIIFLIICFLTVWAGYFFEVKPLLKHTPDPAKKIAAIEKVGGERGVKIAQHIPIPLATFSSAIISMGFTRTAGTDAYLLGEWSRKGWPYYYFVAFAIKNTLPVLILFFLSVIFFRRLGMDRITAAVLWVPILFFFVLTMKDKAQAGIRYFLPVYPLVFILGAGAFAYLWRKALPIRMLVAGLLIWHVFSAVKICPDYLAYFNESVGGPANGYKYLRDSNIDWGQDLKGVGKYVREHNIQEVALRTLSPARPEAYGIPARKTDEAETIAPRHTVYAIDAHQWDAFKWTATTKPTVVIGHSFFIYDFRDKA